MNYKGYTLLETLIAVSIMGIICVASVSLIFYSVSLRDQTKAVTQANDNLRVLNQTLRKIISQSLYILASHI